MYASGFSTIMGSNENNEMNFSIINKYNGILDVSLFETNCYSV